VADYSPVYSGGIAPFSKTASAAVTGGQVVVVSGVSQVGPSGAGATQGVGLAAHDAASGARVTVWPLTNCEHEATASGTVTAGDGVVAVAAGAVATAPTSLATAAAAGTLIGIATTTATNGNKVRFIGRG
jgi:hypothetical protein